MQKLSKYLFFNDLKCLMSLFVIRESVIRYTIR